MLHNWYIRENVKYVSIILVLSLTYSLIFPPLAQANTTTAREQWERDVKKGCMDGSRQYPQKGYIAKKKRRVSASLPAGSVSILGFTVNPRKRTFRAIKKRRANVSRFAVQSASSTRIPCTIENQCVPTDQARELAPCTKYAESGCSEDAELWQASYAYEFQGNNWLEIRASFKNVTNDKTFRQPFCFTVNEETTLGQIETITLPDPELLSDAFGADGILHPGEKTTVLTFRVKHKGRSFSFFVDANAVVEGIATPSPTPSIIPSPSPTPVATPTHLPSPPPTVTPAPTPTPSPIPTATPMPIPTILPTPLPSPTPRVNHPPAIVSNPFLFAMRGEPYGYDAEARDPDRDDVLTFSLDAAPDGMTIDAGSGLISWTPTQEQTGTNEARVRVRDQEGLFDTQAFAITVASQDVDLTISSINASSLSFDGQALTVSGNITAEITNNGPEGIVVPYDVLFFEDVNFNKSYDAPVDNVLGRANVTEPLSAAASATVTAALSGSVRFSGAPIWGYVDSEKRIPEMNEENNLSRSSSGCQVVPRVGVIDPVLEWSWTSSAVDSNSLEVLMTPAIIDLNEDGIPDVIFGSFSFPDSGRGVLRALNGRDGSEIFTVTDPDLIINPFVSVAVGDIDLDGHPEILAYAARVRQLIAFEHNGAFKWRSIGGLGEASPAIADLDGDGIPEIVVGNRVLNNDGSIRWSGTWGGTGDGLSLVADINLDGSPDVVAGNIVYNADGSLQVRFPLLPDGFNAVANFDGDAFPEIVLVAGGRVYLLEHDGATKWGPVVSPLGGNGGPPTIADFDNDGEVEIGVAGARRYVVFETDGSIKWTSVINDGSSHRTGSSVFDFDGDGSAEVVYRDELHLHIFRGTDGVTLFETPMSSSTWLEYVLVADVDADGHAEIVAVANNNGVYNPPIRGVFVYGSASDSWVTTRKIWNQHTYHITNVNDDGTIPAREENNWETYNNYRQNILPETSGPGLYDAPDLIPSYVQVSEGGSGFIITARIGNAGVVTVGPGVSVAFYDGDPKSGGTLLGTTKTTTYIDPGTYEDVSFTVTSGVIQNLFVAADDDGTLTGSVSECNELNNIYDSGKGVIVPSNRPPEITSEAVVYATKGVAYRYDVEATDADEGDVLTFGLVQSPSGMVIDASSGLIQWTPMEDQVGCTEVVVKVVDSHDASDTQSYSLYVTNTLTNQEETSHSSALALEEPLTINLERIPTVFNRPNGIAHHEPTNSLVISFNYPYGTPYSFEQIFEDGTHHQFSTVANLIDEIKIITVRSGNPGGFNTGDLFAGNGRDGEIIRISSDGNTIDNPWVSLPGSDNGLPWGLCVDRTGIYGGDLIVVTTGGEVWRIDSEKNPTQLADVIAYNVNRGGLIGDDYRHNFEAVITLPDDPQYGPWAGKIVAGVNYNNGRIYAFDNSGYVGEWNLGLPDTERLVEDLDLIPENENFYIVEYQGSRVYGVPSSAFDQVAGKILLTQEFHGTSGLFVLSWDPTVESFVKEEVKALLNGRDFYRAHWEHATFSTAGIPGILPVCKSEPKTVSLLTEQKVEVGTVALSANGDNLTVTITSNNGWLLSETDISAKDNVADIPRTAEGRPDRENFELRNTYDPKVVKNEYQISFSGVDTNGDKNIVIAVHVRAQMLEHCDVVKDESAWADGERFTENSWETYTNYQFQCIENTPPEITSEAITNATRDTQYHYDVEATDADGDVLTYSLVTFPENMTINATTGLIEWVPNGDQVGAHEITVRVEDGKGGSDAQTFTITVSGGTTTDLTVTMHANPASIIVGGSSILTWSSTNATSAEMNQGIGSVDVNGSREVSPTETTTYTITVTGAEGTASASATVVVSSTVTVPDVIGMSQAEAAASIAAAGLVVGNVTEMSTTDVPRGRVFNQNPWGGSVVSARDAVDISVSLGIITTDPKVTLISPEPHADIKSPTDIIASITDPDPLDLTWETRFAPVGTEDFRVIGSGAGTVDAAPVGRFDPTLLANDTYRVEINWEKGPRTGGIFFYYSVSGHLKVGNFRLEFTDLQVPLAGIPITIKRVYDTLDLRKGDFGAGWTLGYPGVVRDSVPQGQAFSLRSRVYVTMPDGRRIGFQFAPVQVSPWFPFIFKTDFKPDPGVYDTLSVDEDYVMHSAGYFYTGFFSENFNPSQYTLTTKDGTKYILDEQNGLLGVEDLNGNILTVDETGITHSSGTKIAFVRDTEDRITEIIDPDGNTIHYSYDAVGDLTEKTDQAGLRTQFTYYDTPAHFLREIFDPLGRMAQRTEYDEHGRVVAVYDALGNRVEQDYDPENFLTTQTDRNGNVSEYLYDQNGNVLEIRNPLGGVRKFAYDDPNDPYLETRITDENGNATSYTYDTHGNRLTKTDADDNTTTVTYGDFGNITSIEDTLGRLATFRYDTAGNLTELINPLGLSRKFTRDTQGRITADIDFNGNVTTFDYTNGCSCGLPGKITYPDGAVKTFEYNRFGQETKSVDETGAETVFEYDNLGRKISETDHEGNKYISTYNAHLLVSKTDPLNRTTTFEYDGADNLIKQTDALGGVTQFTYDANGNRTSVTDPVNNKTEFVYDGLNRLVKRIDPLGNTTTYAYDTAGNRIEQVDRNGRKTTFGYDQLNRLTREDWYAGDSVIRSILTTYNEAGSQLSVSDADSSYAFAYDTLNRVEEVDNQGTTGIPRIILGYQYDNNGNLISTEDNLGTRVESAYNSRNFQTRRTWSGGSINPARVDYTYNRRGDRTRVDKYRDLNGNLSAGFSTVGVNPIGLVSNITHFNSTSSSIVEYTYGYDAARQLVNESHHGQTASYEYDQTGQLVEANHSAFDDETYRYDANGNRTSSHRHGSGYVTGPNNQLLSDGDFDYAYDNEGNLVLKTARGTGNITSYTYDHRNRLTNVVEKTSGGTIITQVEFGYDVLNRRIKKSVDGDTVYTAYNFENAWADFDAGGRLLANYFFGDRIDENIARYRPGEGISWYQTDKLGTVRDVSNSSGNIISHVDYDSFGNILGVTDSTAIDRYRFTGREFDEEMGLYYYRARDYNSVVGRFMSLDPIGFKNNESNLYRYILNSPLNGRDPTGQTALLERILVGIISGGLVGCGASVLFQIPSPNKLDLCVNGAIDGVVTGLSLGLFGPALLLNQEIAAVIITEIIIAHPATKAGRGILEQTIQKEIYEATGWYPSRFATRVFVDFLIGLFAAKGISQK